MRCPAKPAGIAPPTAALRREARASRSRSRASGVVTTSTCGAPAAFFPSCPSGSALPASSAAAGPARLVQHVHRGLVGGEDVLGGQRGGHGLVEPACPQPGAHPGDGLVHPAGGDALPPVSMPMSCADRSDGTFPQHESSTAAAFRTGP